ncbi:hypothetical protein DMUE_0557 [Dictyocoela muelleri]|nr:hypothetical protein DMUE_0557 [Dictyocoela muelleri]
MYYFKTYYKTESQNFKFDKDGYILSPEILLKYKKIKKRFVRIIKLLNEYYKVRKSINKNYNLKFIDKDLNKDTNKDIHDINNVLNKDTIKVLNKDIHDLNKDLNNKIYNNNKNFNNKNDLNNSNEILDLCISILIYLINLYDDIDLFLSLLINELFSYHDIYEVRKKKGLLKLFENFLKMLFIFDITRHKKDFIFNDFAEYKILSNKNSIKDIDNKILKISLFAAIAMPMAYLFVSHFMSDIKCVHSFIVNRRNNIYLDQCKKEFLNFVTCIFCDNKKEFEYCLLFFGSTFHVFFGSGFFYEQIKKLDQQKIAYFSGIMNIS